MKFISERNPYYEELRKSRYTGIPAHQYTSEEIWNSYQAWVSAWDKKRDEEWDEYCDARDGVPKGTNRMFRARGIITQ